MAWNFFCTKSEPKKKTCKDFLHTAHNDAAKSSIENVKMAILPRRPALCFYFCWFIFYSLAHVIDPLSSLHTAMLRNKRKNKTQKR
jgi:hypothetical protein